MQKGEMNSNSRPERKIIEKHRREEMKRLCSKLVSLIPVHHLAPAKRILSQQDQLKQATVYIKNLQERVEEMRRKNTHLLMKNPNATNNIVANMQVEPNLPIFQINDLGSDVEVVVITGLRKNFVVHQIIDVIEQEGAQVVTVYISTIDNKILHTFHARAKVSRVGVDTSRISERIQECMS